MGKEGKCNAAKDQIHAYFEIFVDKLKSQEITEEVGELDKDKEDLLKKIDEYIDSGNCNEPSSFELHEGVDEGKPASDLNATSDLGHVIDTIPDKHVNKTVHD